MNVLGGRGGKGRGCIVREEVPDIGEIREGLEGRGEDIGGQGTEGGGGEGRGVGP